MKYSVSSFTLQVERRAALAKMDTQSRSWFMALVTLSQIFGVGAVVLMGVWLGKYQGGYGWGYKNAHKFNYHPLFMTIGLIFLYGDGKSTLLSVVILAPLLCICVHLAMCMTSIVTDGDVWHYQQLFPSRTMHQCDLNQHNNPLQHLTESLVDINS